MACLSSGHPVVAEDYKLQQGDQEDEPRRWPALVHVTVIFTVTRVRENLSGYHAGHGAEHRFSDGQMEVILSGDLPVPAMDGTLKAGGSLAGHDIDKLLEGDGGGGGGIPVGKLQEGVNFLIRYIFFKFRFC